MEGVCLSCTKVIPELVGTTGDTVSSVSHRKFISEFSTAHYWMNHGKQLSLDHMVPEEESISAFTIA
jgi:hypothetical protein